MKSDKRNVLKALLFYSVSIFLFLYSSQLFASSLLSSGQWYKFRISETGVYKISYSQLKNLGFTTINNVKLYGYGGSQLPYKNSEYRPNDMALVPIKVVAGNDGVFNEGDYIICYLEGPVTYDYSSSNNFYFHRKHEYSEYSYYFINCSSATKVEPEKLDFSSGSADIVFTEGDYYDYFEENLYNGIKSGRVWYGEIFDDKGVKKNFTIPELKQSVPVKYRIAALGRNGSYQKIELYINDNEVSSAGVSAVNVENTEGLYGKNILFNRSILLDKEDMKVELFYTGTDAADVAYLNYMTINAKVNLSYTGSKYYSFRNAQSKDYSTVKFNISNLPASAFVWNVTDINNIKELKTEVTTSGVTVTDEGGEGKEYVAIFTDQDYPSPDITSNGNDVGFVDNQNLHGLPVANMLIITHPAFLEASMELAKLHREEDDLTVHVVTPDQIYNEFSSGIPDISALRDFIKYIYELSDEESEKLKYVLLFGDGSYNNVSQDKGNTNYILTYQSTESLNPYSSYVSDDFYGFLEETEGDPVNLDKETLEVGIGRLPVAIDANGGDSQAWDMVDKIKTYYLKENLADWSLRIAFLADDAELSWESGFYSQSEVMATIVQNSKPEFNIEKIYCDAYEQVTTSTGESYPDVQENIVKTLEKGVLVLNYMGHGNENSMTEEKVLQKQDVENLENAPYFPLIITASCQVGRFDHVKMDRNSIIAEESVGEAAVLNTLGGAIASFTTTRVVYQSSNTLLNKNVYNRLFVKDKDGHYGRLGDIIKDAKNWTNGTSYNKLKFTLLGDPAIKFPVPELLVLIDSVNSVGMDINLDTLKAFQEVEIKGKVTGLDSILLSDFDGVVNISVFDKEVEVKTFTNKKISGDGDYVEMSYKDQKNVIYKGKATVKDGHFTTKFRVPKDISYNYGHGKITAFAQDSTRIASGYSRNIVIGGTSDEDYYDNKGPEISLFMNDTLFVDGSITSPNPYVYAKVSDESGINTTGLGIGHDITAYIYETDKKYAISDFFQADLDDYRKGVVNYQIKGLDEGSYTLVLKVWDINNNSSEAEINFVVANDDQLLISDLQNYPNPVNSYTEFHYNHNMPETDHELTIRIYDLSGRLVHEIQRTNYEEGFVAAPIPWNINQPGISSGIYPYRIQVNTSDGKTAYFNQKLIIIK